MDPYLERHWQAVHTQTVGGASRALNRQLPADLVARPEERLGIEADEAGPSHYRRLVAPDTRAFEPQASAAARVGTFVAPFTLLLTSEPVTERFVRVLTVGDERLITVIEFVSPGNKRGDGAEALLAQRDEMLDSGVNWVEVDLVRRGNWRRLLAPHVCPPEGVAAYRYTVRLGGSPGGGLPLPAVAAGPAPTGRRRASARRLAGADRRPTVAGRRLPWRPARADDRLPRRPDPAPAGRGRRLG